MNMEKKYKSPILLTATVAIWGSLYVAGRIVLQSIPALWLLAFRFLISSVILLLIAKRKKASPIQPNDLKHLLIAGVVGYFFSNAALLLGIQHSNASFSSLINALCPIGITLCAIIFLKEHVKRQEIISLIASVIGAAIIIGTPDGEISKKGIFFCIMSVVLWSYAMIHIKILNVKYDALLVTGLGMGIAAILAFPSAIIYTIMTGEQIIWSSSMGFPFMYICLVCTTLSHMIWNHVLSREGAAYCASFYPIQPLTSMVLGVIILKEPVMPSFLAGTGIILTAMYIRRKQNEEKISRKYFKCHFRKRIHS